MQWPALTDEQRRKRLQFPANRVDMVLDTDTRNEVDDQFALTYLLLCPERVNLQAIYAAPFQNERSVDARDGMEQSYGEILRLLGMMHRPTDGLVYKGAGRFLQETGSRPVDSPAVRDLIARAMAGPEDKPLYVVAIGAITNVASALLLAPEIVSKIVVVWLGGHALYWPHTREFNLREDPAAARIVLESGVPLWLVPCLGVTSHLITTVHELRAILGGKNALCDALIRLLEAYSPTHAGYGKALWDVGAAALLIEETWSRSTWERCPRLTDDLCWQPDASGHGMRVVQWQNRNAIFTDMFARLGSFQGPALSGSGGVDL